MGDRLAIIDMDRKLGAVPFLAVELGPYVKTIPCHACSWDIDAFTGRVNFEVVWLNEKHRNDFEG